MKVTSYFGLKNLQVEQNQVYLKVEGVTTQEAKELVKGEVASFIDSAPLCCLLGTLLEKEFHASGERLCAKIGDDILVVSYFGGRLSGRPVRLPLGTSLTFYRIKVLGDLAAGQDGKQAGHLACIEVIEAWPPNHPQTTP